jgi:hypothetical protein
MYFSYKIFLSATSCKDDVKIVCRQTHIWRYDIFVCVIIILQKVQIFHIWVINRLGPKETLVFLVKPSYLI